MYTFVEEPSGPKYHFECQIKSHLLHLMGAPSAPAFTFKLLGVYIQVILPTQHKSCWKTINCVQACINILLNVSDDIHQHFTWENSKLLPVFSFLLAQQLIIKCGHLLHALFGRLPSIRSLMIIFETYPASASSCVDTLVFWWTCIFKLASYNRKPFTSSFIFLIPSLYIRRLSQNKISLMFFTQRLHFSWKIQYILIVSDKCLRLIILGTFKRNFKLTKNRTESGYKES